jgi:hypothetical protein
MNGSTRGVCAVNGKARFTRAEALDKIRKGHLRGEAMIEYRCGECNGWWHTAHAGDDRVGHGGGRRRPKKRMPNAKERRAFKEATRGRKR